MLLWKNTKSCLTLCNTWTAAPHTSLSFTIYQSLLKLMSIELVMPSNHFILCRPLLLLPSNFPSIRVLSSELAFALGGQIIGALASALPINIQGWFPLGLTVWSPCWPRDSQESSPASQFRGINSWLGAWKTWLLYSEIAFWTVLFSQLCLILCDPMDCSMSDFPVLHYLLEFAQIHVIESVMPSNHLILCHPLLLLPSIFPSIRVFSNELALCIRWPEY